MGRPLAQGFPHCKSDPPLGPSTEDSACTPLPTRSTILSMKHKSKGQAKIHKVMSEYASGSLGSSSGSKVKSRKQAVAIAMSEAGQSRKKRKR